MKRVLLILSVVLGLVVSDSQAMLREKRKRRGKDIEEEERPSKKRKIAVVAGEIQNSSYNGGMTQLMEACIKEDLEEVKKLLKDPKVSINSVSSAKFFRNTALMYASKTGNKKIVEELLKREDINLFVKDILDQTAEDLAGENGEIKELIKKHKNYKRSWIKRLWNGDY